VTKLVTTGQGIGLLDGDQVTLLDLPFDDIGEALRAGLTVDDIAGGARRNTTTLRDVHLRPPVPRPSKIWAVGFGYHDHRAEVGFTDTVEEPVIFLKAPSSVVASGEDIRLPQVAPNEVDYEGELGVIVGRSLTAADPDEARAAVAGYTICNDVSARDVQKGRIPGRRPDVSAAKSFDTFTPVGPCLASLDEFEDPDDLRLRTWVDGELRQDSRTAQLIYPVSAILSYLSHQTTLEPGDLVLTGTPGGVGHKRGLFLRPGSTVRIEIENVGILQNTCR
jgi:2-keto-4-pentenoate hydratase/2-oxohepta-3-ene-1,7-dioic acid hydratase in catechol pathway